MQTRFPARIFLAVATLAAIASAAKAADASRGGDIFRRRGCSECHGTVGQGGPGARLAPGALPAEAIAAYIRSPAGEMPPYAERVVSDTDVADIAAYLAAVPKPPAAATLDQLKWPER
jgi:ubiquinol-cytochrome c reductase cytochrome c subunit